MLSLQQIPGGAQIGAAYREGAAIDQVRHIPVTAPVDRNKGRAGDPVGPVNAGARMAGQRAKGVQKSHANQLAPFFAGDLDVMILMRKGNQVALQRGRQRRR